MTQESFYDDHWDPDNLTPEQDRILQERLGAARDRERLGRNAESPEQRAARAKRAEEDNARLQAERKAHVRRTKENRLRREQRKVRQNRQVALTCLILPILSVIALIIGVNSYNPDGMPPSTALLLTLGAIGCLVTPVLLIYAFFFRQWEV